MLVSKIRKNLSKIITAATIAATFAGGTVTALAAGATSTDYVNFRTGPGLNYSVQSVVKPGTAVNIVSDLGYWSKVEVSGKSGYMATEYLKKTATTTTTTPVTVTATAVTTDYLNLRTSGSLSATILTVIPVGTKVDVIGSTTGTWVNVKYGSIIGWVHSDYITISKTATTTPAPAPAPTPAPTPAPAPTTEAGKYNLTASTRVFVTAADAQNGVNSVGNYSAGSYFIFRTYAGMINITKTSGVPGAWINPGTVGTTTPAPAPAPTPSNPYPGYTKMTFDVTFYTDIPWMNSGYVTTATGKKPAYGMLATNAWPFGTVIEIPGWGTFVVEDRGGSSLNTKDRLDMFIPRRAGETDNQYINRLLVMGRQYLTGYVKP